MTSYKLYNTLLLSLSLTLTGCGSDSDDDDTVGTGTDAKLSVTTPIPDMTLASGTFLEFTVPTDTCTDSDGAAIEYSITGTTNNVGFSLINFAQLIGTPTGLGVVGVTVTCKTATESLTDEFTITVTGDEAAPIVEASAPITAKSTEVVTLTAVARDQNEFGSIVSYSWVETSNLDIALTNANTSVATFTVPETTAQTTATFQVTVTDNDGETATDSVDIEFISQFAPTVSLSFPLTLGKYNADAIDMFGHVKAVTGHDLASVVVTVDDVEHTATVTGETWRVEDVTLTETTEIKVVAKSNDDFINYAEVNLVNNDIYETTIDNDIVDIAVNEKTNELYVQLSGSTSNDVKLQQFNLTSSDNSTLTVTQPSGFLYSNKSPTGVTFDSTSGGLFVSYGPAVTEIDLGTGAQTVISDLIEGTGNNLDTVVDLHYDPASDTLYAADNNANEIVVINKTSGDRTVKAIPTSPLSITIHSVTSDLYVARNADAFAASIYKFNGTSTKLDYVTTQGQVSDLALNEAGNELFFVDTTGDLIKLDLIAETQTTVITGLFSVEDVTADTSPMIGLHYHSERNVLFAVGADADGTNKLLVIDPVSGDYAKIAAGDYIL